MLSVLLVACAENEEQPVAPPADVLHHDTMVNVLVDFHILESSLILNVMQDDKAPGDSTRYYNIYKAHNISRERFDASFRYYAARPEELNEIYERVLERLNTMQAEALKTAPPDTSRKLPPVRRIHGVPGPPVPPTRK